jgi:hypothetical protein
MDFKEFSEGSQNVKATVKTDNYSWGKMKTVHHGSSFSIPLHPEHHEAIAKLKDQQEHKFKDETGRHWTAKRAGDDVHFQGANGGNKTKVAHKSIAEESHAPVAPVPDKKYIKGTPENKALKALRKSINGHPTNKMKEETMPQSFKGFLTSLTELTDKQKKIDKNHNGKLDGQDFKMLRKEDAKCPECGKPMSKCDCDMTEEVELEEGYDKSSENHKNARKMAKDYDGKATFHPNGHAEVKMRSIVHGHSTVNPQGTTLMSGEDLAKRASKEHGKGKVAGNIVHFKEEVELDEAMINGREYASHGLMHPDHAKMDIHQKANREVDFYASKTGDKMHGKVMKNDGKEVHIQAHKQLGDGKLHKFKVTPNLPKTTNEETKKEDPPFDGPYTKTPSTVKDKSGAVHGPMSRARDLARKAMQKKMKEEFNIEITEEQAADLCDVASINEKLDMKNADMGDVIKDFQKSDAPQFAGKSDKKRREMAIAAKMQSEETEGESTVKSYKDFVTEIKMADLPRRTVKGTSYGAQYHDPEGDDDADNKKPAKASDAPKRGRGRPSGSKSGAKQQGSEKSSNYGGIDRTTYALHLPNNNK